MTIRIIFFVEYITSLLCGTFTLFVFGSLLYSELSSTPPKFNKSLQLYAFTECLLSTSLLIHFTYLTLIWLGMPPNAFILFFTGGIQTTLFIVSSIAVTTLGIDRCLGIAFPTRKRGPACGFNFVAMNAIFLALELQLGDYAGPYSSVIGCVPSALCAAFYFNGFNSLKSQNT
uniref:7TM GPCR serpentine receptor class x (Srx) domain-containing protein n=1 Tax=Panagrellus redivivus TaxID=6233 RepID=A0A7E4W8F2_PANRE